MNNTNPLAQTSTSLWAPFSNANAVPYWWKLALTWVIACLIAPGVQAQVDNEDGRRWTLRAFYSLPDNWAERNTRGLVHFLETNGFGDDTPPGNFFGGVKYPQVQTEDASWSIYAAYAIRPYLSVGALFYNAQQVNVAGRRYEADQETSFDINLQQTMWALAPIALWRPVGFLDMGVGPAFIQGGTAPYVRSEGRIEAQETSFQRLGAVVFGSIGFTVLNRYLYLGLQGQFVYGGTAEIGPYVAEESFAPSSPSEFTLDAQEARIDQLTWGPVIALNL